MIRLTSVPKRSRALEFELELAVETAAVEQLGQRIGVGGLGEAGDQPRTFSRVSTISAAAIAQRADGDDPRLDHPGRPRA